MTLTLFTPTYNRGHLLSRLYDSIATQKQIQDLEWLIVDDGSTDDTKQIVDNFIKESKVNINYIWQENQGKMQAHNTALDHAKGTWFLCIDSDDWLNSDALDVLLKNMDVASANEKLAGILTMKKLLNSQKEKPNYLPTPDGTIINLSGLTKLGFQGEVNIFFKTEILKKFPFPKFDGEKYVPENIVYDLIDQKYKYITFNEFTQTAEYQEDGYTIRAKTLNILNPFGVAAYQKQKSRIVKNPIEKCKRLASYVGYSLLAKDKKIIRNSGNMLLCLIAFPVGLAYSKKLKQRRNAL